MFKKHFLPVFRIIFFCFAFSLIVTTFISLFLSKSSPPSSESNPAPTVSASPLDNRLSYKNNILGLEFKYPKEWGDIHTSPENITNLAQLHLDRNDYQGIHDRIMFVPTIFQTQISLYNDQHQGENPPYAEYERSAEFFLDNFNTLKSTGNICDYHIKFNGPRGNYKEVSFSCDPQTNTSQSVIEVKKTFDNGKIYYEYQLQRQFYKKLNNKFYNHLLISESDTIAQSENNPIINNISDVYNYFSQSDLEQKNAQFIKFTSSIKTFPAQAYSPQKHKKISSTDPNIDTVYQYYDYIEQGQIQSAYDMYQTTNTSFPDYRSWYENVIFTDPIQVVKQSNNLYQIDVIIQDRNKAQETYRVSMKVSQGKIETISSVRLIGETIYDRNLSTRIEASSQTQRLIFTQNGQDFTLATCPNYSKESGENFVSNCYYSHPSFIPDGKYLIVRFGAWEYGSYKIYDLQTKKEIIETPSAHLLEVTVDNQQIITCASDFFFAGVVYISLYDINDPTHPKELLNTLFDQYRAKELNDFTCRYNQDQNTLIVDADFGPDPDIAQYSQQYLYQIDTGQITVISP